MQKQTERVESVMSFDVDDNESLRTQARMLLEPFGFAERNRREVWQAFVENPDGVERCALLAKAKSQRLGVSGAGLLLTMIRSGEHLLEPDPTAPRVTGWRFVRGTHSGTYVEDPNGVDPLPPGYDFSTHAPTYESPHYDDEPLETFEFSVANELKNIERA